MKEYRIITMYSKALDREKRIFVYVPKSYETSNKEYPVLYMHDGQNLFDDRMAHMQRSWRILDAYEEIENLPEVIIVGIESDSIERADELIPFEFLYRSGNIAGGKAKIYLDFIVEQVKPFIDKRFRTKKSAKHTGIMGSSFGGVNSMYAALEYSDCFTRFGCLSSALLFGQICNEMKELISKSTFESVRKFYMDVGTNEATEPDRSKAYVKTNIELNDILKEKLEESILQFNIIKGGIHNETSWEKRFPEIIQFMFND